MQDLYMIKHFFGKNDLMKQYNKPPSTQTLQFKKEMTKINIILTSIDLGFKYCS